MISNAFLDIQTRTNGKKKSVKGIAVYRSLVTPCSAYTLHYTSSNLKSLRKTKGRQVPKNSPAMMLSQTDLLLVVHGFEIPEKRTVAKLTVVTLIPISRLKMKMFLKCNVNVVSGKSNAQRKLLAPFTSSRSTAMFQSIRFPSSPQDMSLFDVARYDIHVTLLRCPCNS